MIDLSTGHEFVAQVLGVLTFPCHKDKRPRAKGWQQGAPVDPERDTHYGIVCGGASELVVVDIDEQGAFWEWVGDREIPETLCVETPSGGRHLYFLCSRHEEVRNGVRRLPGADIRSDGGYVVGPGSEGYQLVGEETEAAALPGWLLREILLSQQNAGARQPCALAAAAEIERSRDRESNPVLARIEDVCIELMCGEHPMYPGGAQEIFQSAIPNARQIGNEWHGACPHCGEGDDRLRLHEDGGRDGEIAFAVCRRCERRCDMLDLVHVAAVGRPITKRGDALGTLHFLGRAGGLESARHLAGVAEGDPEVFEEPDLVWGLGLTDQDHAERVRALHGPEIRFLPELPSRDRGLAPSGWWVRWDEEENRWVEDVGVSVMQRVFHTGLVLTSRFEEGLTDAEAALVKMKRGHVDPTLRDDHDRLAGMRKALDSLRNVGKASQVLKALRTDYRVVTRLEVFDRVAHLLNTPSGVVDLRTGERLEPDPAHLCMKATAAPFMGLDTPAPLWDRFLREIMGGDAGMVSFLQRMAGSAAIGKVMDQYLFVLWGTGANGKTVFTDTIARVLGEYAGAPRAATLLRSRWGVPSSSAREDLAALAGVRYAPCEEPQRGLRLDEAIVKEVTGGATISCRRNYGHEFSYRPQFALWLSCNTMPEIDANDDGTWRRVATVPFEQSFLGREDESLQDKLLTEMPGILAWVVRGAVERYRFGLQIPQRCLDFAREERSEADVFRLFFEMCCEPGEEGDAVLFSDLFDAYQSWCIKERIEPASAKRFSTEMVRIGLVRDRSSNVRLMRRVKLGGS